MKLCTLFLASLALTYLPLSLSYRDGARSESCYNMLVMHTDFLGRIVSPTECGDPCQFQLLLIRRVFEGNRLAPLETTYQCGETYHCKWTLGSKVCLFVSFCLFIFPTVRLMSIVTTTTFEGFMVEARESTDFFGEGSTIYQEDFDNKSTIWGTWVTDPNMVGSGGGPNSFLYHTVECNRSLESNEGPFEVSVLYSSLYMITY